MWTASRGFTLLEATITAFVAGFGFLAAVTVAGRFFVEQTEAIETAKKAGFTEVSSVERHDWFPRSRGCVSDEAIAFLVEGKAKGGEAASGVVCCGTWFKGCTFRER